MKRFAICFIALGLATSSIGCCYRSRCCRPACGPCSGAGTMGAPATIPFGAVPTGSLDTTYGAMPMTSPTGPVAFDSTYSPTTSAYMPTAQTTAYPSSAISGPNMAALPTNPLPTF